MAARLWGPSHRSAAWLINNDVLAQLVGESFDNGAPVLTNAADGGKVILGMPVELVEYTKPISETGDILLGDFSQYLVAEKEPQVLSSIHIKFVEDEGAFKLRYRLDGQPAWATPVTPRNSSATQSPFVTLGARA